MKRAALLIAATLALAPAHALPAQPQPQPQTQPQSQPQPEIQPKPATPIATSGVVVRDATGPDGQRVPFLLSMPPGHDPSAPVRVVIALPPGTQSEDIARACIDRSFGQGLTSRGYVVAMPFAAPSDAGIDPRAVETLFDHLATVFRMNGNKVLLAGVQNGGKAAFRAAIAHPEHIAALLVLPGLPPDGQTDTTLQSLNSIPVLMLVGSEDSRWRTDMEAAQESLQHAGVQSTLIVVEGDGHMLPSMNSTKIADLLDRLSLLAAGGSPTAQVGQMLDTWHAAAASADEEAYFSLFADDSSIFMGTDATERWTAPEFRAWAKPYFDRGRAWSFKVVERHTYLSPDESIAWFDEVLDTPNMGPCRGSGVAVKRDGAWKVAHYNLTVPVPNAILDRVVEMVEAELKNPTPAADPNQPPTTTPPDR